MQQPPVRIGDFIADAPTARPSTYQGALANRPLAVIECRVRTRIPQEDQAFRELLEQSAVTVEDPFAGRTYEASIEVRQESYSSGSPIKAYDVEVREIDKAPSFTAIEIDGRIYPVIKHVDKGDGAAGVSHHVVLRVSGEQLATLRRLFGTEARQAMIRRVGVDDAPSPAHFGYRQYWSEHVDDSGQPYYKQLVRLFPRAAQQEEGPFADAAHSLRWAIYSSVQDALRPLTMRFEALCAALVESGVLTPERRDTILGPEVSTLLAPERLDWLSSEEVHVDDAEQAP